MKSLLVLVLLIGVAAVHSHHVHDHEGLTQEQIEKIHKEAEECVDESKVDKQLLDDIKDGKKFEATHELNCYAACIFKKSGLMKADGTIDQDRPSKSEEAKECKKLTGADECETAGKVMGCFAKHKLIPKF